MTTYYDQPITTYSDTLAHKRVVGDLMQIIDPRETPLVSLLGLDSARSKFKINMNGTKIEVLEDHLDPIAGVIANGTVALTTSTLSFTVGDGTVFSVGQVLLVDAEYMVITEISGNVVTVGSRAYGGTNATHTTNAVITVVGMARLEGADATFGPIVALSAPYNYTTIFERGIKVSGTMEVIDQYAIHDEFDYQSAKALPSLLRLVERMLFYGIRSAGSATTPRSAGGLATFITTNSSTATTVNKTVVDAAALAVHLAGGTPDLFVCNPAIANAIRNLTDSSSYVRVTLENTRFGMNPVTEIMTQWGGMRIVDDRWCPLAQAYALDSRKVGLYSLRPFFSHKLAITGDSISGEVIGEFSLLVANEEGMYKFTALAG